MEFVNLTVLLQLITVCAQGSFVVELRVVSYTNPSNTCAQCSFSAPFQGPFGCCDRFEEMLNCAGDDRCDNYFRYCLRDFRTSDQTRGCTSGIVLESNRPEEVNFGVDTNFSSSLVLGLANPLPLLGQENQWQGIQIYIEARDHDERGTSDEIIDTFSIDIPPSSVIPGSPESEVIQLTGTFGISMMNISYRVLCQEFFYGNLCENYNNCLAMNVTCENGGTCRNLENDFQCDCVSGHFDRFCQDNDNCFGVTCSNRGRCQNGTDYFICECDPGYTGQLCEIELNECIGVNCSERGVCEDRVNSFICRCDPGYTGQECEIDIDDCVGVSCSGNGHCIDGVGTFTCLCDQGFTGRQCAIQLHEAVIAGGIIGGVLIMIVIAVACTLAVGALRRERDKKAKELPPANLQDNPSYGLANPVHRVHNGGSVRCYTALNLEDNPAYGLSNQVNGAHNGESVRCCTSAASNATSNRPSSIQSHELEADLDGSPDDHTYAEPTVPQPQLLH